MLAAIIAYAVNGWFVGWHSLFQSLSLAAGLADLAGMLGLGIASGILGRDFARDVLPFRDAFSALPVPAWLKPGIGGLLLGLLALELPQILGGGYGWVQEAIDGRLALHLLIILAVAKMVALSFTISRVVRAACSHRAYLSAPCSEAFSRNFPTIRRLGWFWLEWGLSLRARPGFRSPLY